jgi:hypothetical protein
MHFRLSQNFTHAASTQLLSALRQELCPSLFNILTHSPAEINPQSLDGHWYRLHYFLQALATRRPHGPGLYLGANSKVMATLMSCQVRGDFAEGHEQASARLSAY